MNWLDWIILLVIGFSALQGMYSGLLAGLTRLLGIVAGFVVAASYYRTLAGFLSDRLNLDTIIAPLIKEGIKKLLPAGYISPGGDITSLSVAPVIPGVPSPSDLISQTVAAGFLDVISFLALFLAVTSLASAIGHMLTGLANLSLLGPVNSIGGLVFGLVRGFVLVVIILALLAPFQLPAFSPGEQFLAGKALRESRLAPYFQPLVPVIKSYLPDAPPVFKEFQKITENFR